MRNMADLLDDESILYSSDDVKPIEVLPEMLDYAFVDTCESINELRAVMKALKSREWGSYPDLENHTRIKLMRLLPDRDKKRISAVVAMPSPSTVSTESENLRSWLDDIVIASRKNDASNSCKQMKHSAVPVRGVKLNDSSMVDPSMADNSANGSGSKKIISKPLSKVRFELASLPYNLSIIAAKLYVRQYLYSLWSLQEYFDRWNQFEALDSSDDESEAACKNESVIEQASQRRATEQSQLQDRLPELSNAERKIMSIREREKGNEYFKVFDNDEALLCYTKSICLDESNEKSYANRAAVLIRQSNFDRAIDDCTKALEINPLYVKALARRAMCYHNMGRFREAVSDFEACQKLDDCADIVRLLQRSKEKLEKCQISVNTPSGNDEIDVSEVIEEVFTPGALKAEKLPTRKISSEKAIGCTRSLLNEDQVSRAASSQTWNKMRIIETDNVDDDDEIVETTAGMRRINIEEEIDSQDNNHYQHVKDSGKLKEEGNDAMAQRRFADAVNFYTHALDLNPFNYSVLYNRSIAYFKLSEWGESIADANACLLGEPNNTKALYRRGFAQMIQSHDELSIKKALCDFEQSLSLQPPNDQRVVLLKKIEKCKQILSSFSEQPQAFNEEELKDHLHASRGMQKVRRHDSQALAF